jgi:hypothetical protein
MLDVYHRAAYRVHSSMRKHVGDHRVYYVICQTEKDKFVVMGITCSPNAPKRELGRLLPINQQQPLQIFTAKGELIERLADGRGRYNELAYKHVMRVDLTPLPQAA